MSDGVRIKREKQTIETMLRLYCRKQHGGKTLCPECQKLLDYAMIRLSNCKFAEQKPTCGSCPIHCYKPDMRQQVIGVMKYAGPRMLWSHPVMALRHVFEGRRKVKN